MNRLRIQLELSNRPNAKDLLNKLCEFTRFNQRTAMIWHVLKSFIPLKEENERMKGKIAKLTLENEILWDKLKSKEGVN